LNSPNIHPNWYFILNKKTQSGTVELTPDDFKIIKGKKVALNIALSDIHQISKAIDKNEPVVKLVTSNQEIILKPLSFGETNLEAFVDQLITAIENYRGGSA
jgi:hypothetical protein